MIALKRFGQNFLIDSNILAEIISRSDLSENDCVLEVGIGHGVLTKAILAQNVKCLYAIELDERLKPEIENLAIGHENLKIFWADAVKFDYSKLNPFPNKIVANIPYNITTPLIWELLKYSSQGLKNHLYMLQKESALRLTAPPDTKERYPLGITIEAMGHAKIIRNVSRNCFRPVPNVDSALVEIVINKNFELLNNDLWSELLHKSFSHRRKTLTNNLKDFHGININEILSELNINENIRAEDLECEEWLRIYENCRKIEKFKTEI